MDLRPRILDLALHVDSLSFSKASPQDPKVAPSGGGAKL